MKIQMETMLWFHIVMSEWFLLKNQKTAEAWGCGEMEHLSSVGLSADLCSHYGNQWGESSKNTRDKTPIWHRYTALGHVSKELSIIIKRYFSIYVYCGCIHNGEKIVSA